jgi:hypothetical protein
MNMWSFKHVITQINKKKWNKTNQKLKHNKSILIRQTIVKLKMVPRTYGKKFVQDNQCNDQK